MIVMEICFNKILHINGHPHDASLIPIFWLLCIMSQYHNNNNNNKNNNKKQQYGGGEVNLNPPKRVTKRVGAG
jgi:hypothetical protein